MNQKTIVQGYGAAIMILLLPIWPLLSSRHSLIFHSILPIQSVVWGFPIDLGIVSALAALLFAYMLKQRDRRSERRSLGFGGRCACSPRLSGLMCGRCGKRIFLISTSSCCSTALCWGACYCSGWALQPTAVSCADLGWLPLLTGCGMAWILPRAPTSGPESTAARRRATGCEGRRACHARVHAR